MLLPDKVIWAVLIAAILSSYFWLLRIKASGGNVFGSERPVPPQWNWADVMFVSFVFFLAAGVLGLLLRGGVRAEGFLPVSAIELFMVCVIIRVIRLRGQDPSDAFGLRMRGLARPMASALALFLAFLPVFVLTARSWQWTLVRLCGENVKISQDMVDRLRSNPSAAVAAQIIIMALLVAPLAEEVFFRGFLYGALRREVRPALAIPAVGLLFGAVHSPLAVVVPMALFGGLLCYIYEKTARLTIPILVHFIFNTCQVALMMSYR